LGGYSRSTNGSRTEKSGIEFAFTSQRIRAIATRITVTGAYFRTLERCGENEFQAGNLRVEQKIGIAHFAQVTVRRKVETAPPRCGAM